MVNQYLNCHQCRASTAHLGVKEDDSLVFADIGWQDEEVQFWLSSADTALDQNSTCLAVMQHTFQARL
jgi:hypothetical protein